MPLNRINRTLQNPKKVIYSVNVIVSISELVLNVFYSIMFLITKIGKSIIRLKAIGVNNGVFLACCSIISIISDIEQFLMI